MEKIIEKAKELPFNSLEYVDLEDISDSKVFKETEKCVLIYKVAEGKTSVYWAADTKKNFIKGIKEIMAALENKKVYIEFIPEAFVEDLENIGFTIVSEWLDFWNNNLKPLKESSNTVAIRPLKDSEFKAAANITKACKGSSRGFTGESEKWIKEWFESEHSHLFVAEKDKIIVGMCCVKLYGFDSEKGTVLWLREIAVSPTYQSQGIGHSLITYAINWGIEHGAKRSFLACDADNDNAIRIYESFGYRKSTERGQINMER